MGIHLVYMTMGSKEEAVAIGKELVTSKLAACINLIDNMNSIYFWEGKLQEDKEVILIAKTPESKVPELTEKVKALHSYDCPCIISFPVSGGNKSFIDWVKDEVAQGK